MKLNETIIRTKAIAKIESLMKKEWMEVDAKVAMSHEKDADYQVWRYGTWCGTLQFGFDPSWRKYWDTQYDDWSSVKRVKCFINQALRDILSDCRYSMFILQSKDGKWYIATKAKKTRAIKKVSKDFNENDNSKLIEKVKSIGKYGLVSIKNADAKCFKPDDGDYYGVNAYWCDDVEQLIERLSNFSLKDGGWSVVDFKLKKAVEGCDPHFVNLQVYVSQSKAHMSNIDGELLDAISEGFVSDEPLSDEVLADSLEKIVMEKTTSNIDLEKICQLIAMKSNKNFKRIAHSLASQHIHKANEAFFKITGGRSSILDSEFSKIIHGSDEGWKLYCERDIEQKRKALLVRLMRAA